MTVRSLLAIAAALVAGCATAPGDAFDWKLTPDRATTTAGGMVGFRIDIESKTNINSDVELEGEDIPSELILSMPAKIASTVETVEGTIYVAPGTAEGTYAVNIKLREVGGSWSVPQTVLVFVTNAEGQPDFSLEVEPTTATLSAEFAPTLTFYVRPLNGFLGTVSLALTGLTDDLRLSQDLTPSTIEITSGGKGGTFVVGYAPTPPVMSPVVLTVTATAGSLSHSRTITLTLQNGPSVPGM
jgi:hypothetical protein